MFVTLLGEVLGLSKDVVYVVGHRRPDTDSIASAISYAYLKNAINHEFEYVPARLGELSSEAAYVLSKFGVQKPILLEHVYIQVKDAMTVNPVVAGRSATLYEVGTLMLERHIRDVPIVDDCGRLLGVVTERGIAQSFLQELQNFSFGSECPKISDVQRGINAKLLVGKPDWSLCGRLMVGAMSVEMVKTHLKRGDILIVGDREDIQKVAISMGASCLVVTGGVSPSGELLKEASERGVAVLLTDHTTYIASRLLRLSTPAVRVAKQNPLTVGKDALLKEFADELMEDRDGVAIVVGQDMMVEGIITRHDLINPKKKRVILVDHSELSQAVDGIEDAEILEIVDHHRLGDVQTDKPITAYVEPVGCTSTIIWGLFKLSGVKPTKGIAGIMLSAILSDTMILRSPTTTQKDKVAVEELSGIVGIAPNDLGVELYRAKVDLSSLSVKEILSMDMKELRTPKGTIAISQVEVVDTNSVLSMHGEVKMEMERLAEERGYVLFLLMVTDVVEEFTELVVVGKRRLVEKAFGIPFEGDSVRLPGVVSRKKQVIPPLLKSL